MAFATQGTFRWQHQKGSDSSTGYVGVTLNAASLVAGRRSYRAEVCTPGGPRVKEYLGMFDTAVEAAVAYARRRQELEEEEAVPAAAAVPMAMIRERIPMAIWLEASPRGPNGRKGRRGRAFILIIRRGGLWLM